MLSLSKGDTMEEFGPTKRRRLSGRVEEIVQRLEVGGGEMVVHIQTQLRSESRRKGGGGGRNCKRLVGRFGGDSQ